MSNKISVFSLFMRRKTENNRLIYKIMTIKEELESKLRSIREQEEKELVEQNYAYFKSFEGKCFKTKSHYSKSKSWWLYIKVTNIEKDNIYSAREGKALCSFKGVSFQTCTYSITTIDRGYDSYIHSLEAYTEITNNEFNTAFTNMLGEIVKITI